MFTQAKEKGVTAAHVAAKDKSFKTFKTNLLVEASETVEFKLTYQQLLKRRNGLYDYSISINPEQPVEAISLNINIVEDSNLRVIKILPLQTEQTYKKSGYLDVKDKSKRSLIRSEVQLQGADVNCR